MSGLSDLLCFPLIPCERRRGPKWKAVFYRNVTFMDWAFRYVVNKGRGPSHIWNKMKTITSKTQNGMLAKETSNLEKLLKLSTLESRPVPSHIPVKDRLPEDTQEGRHHCRLLTWSSHRPGLLRTTACSHCDLGRPSHRKVTEQGVWSGNSQSRFIVRIILTSCRQQSSWNLTN